MEHHIAADHDGEVADVLVVVGETVPQDTVLLRIVPTEQIADESTRPPVRGANAAASALVEVAAPPTVGHDDQRRLELIGRRAARFRTEPVGGRQLTARGRIERLVDPRSFVQPAPLRRGSEATYAGKRVATDGDGVIAGVGTVDGRPVAVASHDFSVAGGSIGSAFADSVVQLQSLAMDIGAPIVYLNDSGGARIHEGIQSLNGCGRMFAQNVRARRVVPQVSVIMGPCAGAAAYSPALTDWTVMVRDRGQMFLTGPEVVRTVTGEAIEPNDLGGALLHTRESGVAHLDAADEVKALDNVRLLLGFLPSRAGGPLPAVGAAPPQTDPARLADLVPAVPSKPFNMRRVLAGVLDGSDAIELMPRYGTSVLTGFARLDGVPVGIVASQPKCIGGILDAQTATKCARFVDFCGRFGLPVLTFLDVPGFMPGSAEERRGVITQGAAMLAAYVDAPVPKLTTIVRKAYGGAYIAMGSRSLGADFTWAWTSAELAVMGPEAAVGLLHRRELAAAPDPAATRQELAAAYRDTVTRPALAAEAGIVDDVILPEESRDLMVAALHLLMGRSPAHA